MPRRLIGITLLACLPGAALAQAGGTDWNAPFPPHRIMDNLYYVGTTQLGSFLVTTPEGHILINSDVESTVPVLEANVEALGFDFDDIAILLGSHAHGDHMEGDALVDNPDYPSIADDYRATFATARRLPVDVFLGAHGVWYDLAEKYERRQNRGPNDPNPFVDPAGYRAHVDLQARAFEAMLAEQQ